MAKSQHTFKILTIHKKIKILLHISPVTKILFRHPARYSPLELMCHKTHINHSLTLLRQINTSYHKPSVMRTPYLCEDAFPVQISGD